MTMAPHPERLAEQANATGTSIAEGRATRRITLVDPSSPQIRILRTQASNLNRELSTEILDLLALLASGGEGQWRVARSKALKLLNSHDRALAALITGVLEMKPEELADMAQFRAPGTEPERTPDDNRDDRHSDSPRTQDDRGRPDPDN